MVLVPSLLPKQAGFPTTGRPLLVQIQPQVILGHTIILVRVFMRCLLLAHMGHHLVAVSAVKVLLYFLNNTRHMCLKTWAGPKAVALMGHSNLAMLDTIIMLLLVPALAYLLTSHHIHTDFADGDSLVIFCDKIDTS